MDQNDIYCVKAIKGAVEKIMKFTNDFTDADEFYKHDLSFDAVMMNLMVISDMVTKISNEVKEKYSEINWKQVKIIEENVINNYLGIHHEYVWRIVKVHLPVFKEQLATIPV